MTGPASGGASDAGAPIVVVSGLPRSGTSMMMAMLHAGGLPIVTDGVRAADDSNPAGYFEDERVKALEHDTASIWLSEARGKAVKVISSLLHQLPDTHRYRVVFMHRDLQEVLSSQRRMLERLGRDADEPADAALAAAFERHLRDVSGWLDSRANFAVLNVQHRDLIDRPASEAARVAAFVGASLDVPRMAAVVDPSLYRARV